MFYYILLVQWQVDGSWIQTHSPDSILLLRKLSQIVLFTTAADTSVWKPRRGPVVNCISNPGIRSVSLIDPGLTPFFSKKCFIIFLYFCQIIFVYFVWCWMVISIDICNKLKVLDIRSTVLQAEDHRLKDNQRNKHFRSSGRFQEAIQNRSFWIENL